MDNIFIRSLSYYIPKGRLSNDEVLERINESNKYHLGKEELQFIIYGNRKKFEFLGIKTRSYCIEDEKDNAVSMACKSSLGAIKKADIKLSQIDCIIASGVTNPFREPSFAIVLANQLGIKSCDLFDVNDTCNGFLKSIDIAKQFLLTGKHRNILVVVSESPYEIADGLGLDYRIKNIEDVDNRFTSFIVGSGAAAMILSNSGNGKCIRNYYEKRETVNWDASLLTIPNISLPDSKIGNKSCGIWTDARFLSTQI